MIAITIFSTFLLLTQLAAEPTPRTFVINEARAAAQRERTAARWQTFEATAYTARCVGCTGITKSGVDVRQTIYHEGRRVVAVDPQVIPLGSSLTIRLADGTTIEAIAEDIGGAIKGARVDVLHADKQSAYKFGRQSVELRVN